MECMCRRLIGPRALGCLKALPALEFLVVDAAYATVTTADLNCMLDCKPALKDLTANAEVGGLSCQISNSSARLCCVSVLTVMALASSLPPLIKTLSRCCAGHAVLCGSE